MITDRPARLKVGVVGCGRVGAVLGAALVEAGHRVVAVSGMSEHSRERARRLLPGVPILLEEEVVDRSELVLLTPPAAALAGLVRHLCGTNTFLPGQIVVHTHPGFGIGILSAARNVMPLAIHPATRFTGTPSDLARLRVSHAAVTSQPERRAVAEALAVEMGAEPVWVDEEARATYAAGIALIGDHVHALYEIARALGSQSHISDFSELLAGYLQASAEVVHSRGAHPHGAAERGDAVGLSRDLRALASGHPDARSAYRTAARLAVAQALRAGAPIDLRDDGIFDALATGEGEGGGS